MVLCHALIHTASEYQLNMMKKWTCFEIMYWFFSLPTVSAALLPSVCLPVTLSHALVNEALTHTRTHSSSTACCMVWATDISLQAICQSELDVLAWSHTNTPNHTHMNMPNLQWMNEGFFRPVYLIIHMCVLDSRYVTLHSLLWLSAI